VTGERLRRRLFAALKAEDIDGALELLGEGHLRRRTSPLFSALCSPDELIRWRAVTVMGLHVATLARDDFESARHIVRRLMWSLNEESGNMGWGAPEAMGEIMACHEGLAAEFAPILLSYIREEGSLAGCDIMRRGVIWGLGRLAQRQAQLLRSLGTGHHLVRCLASRDSATRGLAAWTLGLLGEKEVAPPRLKEFLTDETEIPLYLDRKLLSVRVGDLAREALTRLRDA
jgi:hypothetical protein